jgi:putative component of membrane protein insertase Oxa1/YidC/SpoIIIJ protein YidD
MAASSSQQQGDVVRDDIIVTLRPEGSPNNEQFVVRKRELYRPKTNYWKAAINMAIPVMISIGICFFDVRIACVFFCLYVLIKMRLIAEWCIRLYQQYASDEMRMACVFEPSCSEYMILSIRKYGVIRGIAKGIDRLGRCRAPNGGEDFP